MRITLDTRKSVQENAAEYFDRAKKAKRKLEGAKKAIAIAQEKLASLAVSAQKAAVKEEERRSVAANRRKLEWFEKLRWFVSSDGFLCIGGRDVTTNEIIVKKHAVPGDLLFHTDMAGAPFVVIKAEGKEIPLSTQEEAAQFCASYSRGWKNGLGYLEVFCATPEQLSKEPNSGEFLPKGAFVVRGHVKYFKPELKLCIGKDKQERIMCAAESAVLAQCGRGYAILQGNDKSSDVAKRVASLLGAHVDEIVPLLPSGGCKLGKEVKPMRKM
jgi:predicted ribosome quality control (RQC) complex YloA/Tae2 family protein